LSECGSVRLARTLAHTITVRQSKTAGRGSENKKTGGGFQEVGEPKRAREGNSIKHEWREAAYGRKQVLTKRKVKVGGASICNKRARGKSSHRRGQTGVFAMQQAEQIDQLPSRD